MMARTIKPLVGTKSYAAERGRNLEADVRQVRSASCLAPEGWSFSRDFVYVAGQTSSA